MKRFFPLVIYALNFSWWKRSVVRCCFAASHVVFVTDAAAVPVGSTLAVWGMLPIPGLSPGTKLLRLEDGFLRSVGLGAELIRPVSWVVDRRGMYYDATRPSDLEEIFATTVFTPAMVARAAALRQRIVAEGLTKYNVGAAGWQRPVDITRVILVPGQVESDASLAYGAPDIRTNIGLLQAVRKACPEVYILYKPHPDVVAGLRARGTGEDEASQWCDEQVMDVPMAELLTAVDEVHVLTSLAGFEALLRGKAVTCYGQPFYAGWGLTRDIAPLARRSRNLTLDELVAGALIDYPLYLSRTGDALITPEQALDELLVWRSRSSRTLSWRRRCFRMILRLVTEVR